MVGFLVRLPEVLLTQCDAPSDALLRIGVVMTALDERGRCYVMHAGFENGVVKLVQKRWNWHDLIPVNVARSKKAAIEWRSYCERVMAESLT